VTGQRIDAAVVSPDHAAEAEHHARHALRAARSHLQKLAVRLVGYLVLAYLVLKLIPGLEQALSSLEHVSWRWALGAVALETASEMGFVLSWRAIVDPDDLLSRDGRGHRMATRAAWAQLGGGTLVPGGSLGGIGVGAWILHRFGMPAKLIAEREFNLSFLNTAIDGLVLVVFGVLLATGILPGERRLTLTLLPAALAAIAIVAARLVARRAETRAERVRADHPKIAKSIATLGDAVEDTDRLLFHRGGLVSVFGALVYLGFDLLVLWSAFWAVHAHPVPGFAVLVMAYIIGALGGSIPFLPLNVGTIGGMVGMFILYGVGHDAAVVAVLIYQAIGLLVPLVGGGIAYAVLRRGFGPVRNNTTDPSGEHRLAGG
jgi:uncharacterized membrane protein YbhN (UPF0104 family)